MLRWSIPEFCPACGGYGRPIGRERGFGTNSSRDLPYARGASSRGEGIDRGAVSTGVEVEVGVGVEGVFDFGAGLLASRR